jgi:hypothetical protein
MAAFKTNDCVCGFCPRSCGCDCHRSDSLSCTDIVDCIKSTDDTTTVSTFAGMSRNDLFRWIDNTFTKTQQRAFYKHVDIFKRTYRVTGGVSKKSASNMVPSNISIVSVLLGKKGYQPAKTISKKVKCRRTS